MVLHSYTGVTRDNRNTQTPFTITNWTEDVAMDCNNAADAELADVLGTLIKHLMEQGIINGTINTGA